MNRLFTLLFLAFAAPVFAQQSGSFVVGGDIDKFYPVKVIDGAWDASTATVMEIGRAAVHLDSDWRGSMIARFRFHGTRWGNGARFIDAEIMQIGNKLTVQNVPFVAGWRDATPNNGSYDMIVWLKGGGTTYYYKSGNLVNPIVYDGVQNALPLVEAGGPSHSFKSSIDTYVNSGGLSNEGTAYFRGAGINYFGGNVGIGTYAPDEKLTVNGKIHATEIRVDTSVPAPDYVFTEDYKLLSLAEIERYVQKNSHLPDVPSAVEMETKGVNVSEMQMLLLKKIEELTLHLIESSKQIAKQNAIIQTQGQQINTLKQNVSKLLLK